MKMVKRLLFIFILFFFSDLFFSSFTLFSDGFWCYSFSYSMSKGLIPYVDFNMVVPVLYPLLGAFFFKIFGTSYPIFILFNTILMTFMFYFLFKLYDKKAYLFLIIILFSYFQLVYPTYNAFLLLLFFMIIFLEKNNKNDYVIGLIIGLAIITKFNVGIFFFLPSFYYYKDRKKILKRLVGLIVPCFFFLMYLVINNNFSSFIDLAVLGLITFNSDNHIFGTVGTFIFILISLVLIIKIIKEKNNIYNYYAFSSVMFAFPINDTYHLYFFIFCAFVAFIDKIKVKNILPYFTVVFSIICFCYLYFCYYNVFDAKSFFNNKDFKNYYVEKTKYDEVTKLMKCYEEYEGAIVLSDDSLGVFLDLYYNQRTRYFDLFNRGNYGYRELENVKKHLEDMKKQYFIIKNDEQIVSHQYFLKASKYIISKSKFIKDCGNFKIYLYN